jgi:hypothetical protein
LAYVAVLHIRCNKLDAHKSVPKNCERLYNQITQELQRKMSEILPIIPLSYFGANMGNSVLYAFPLCFILSALVCFHTGFRGMWLIPLFYGLNGTISGFLLGFRLYYGPTYPNLNWIVLLEQPFWISTELLTVYYSYSKLKIFGAIPRPITYSTVGLSTAYAIFTMYIVIADNTSSFETDTGYDWMNALKFFLWGSNDMIVVLYSIYKMLKQQKGNANSLVSFILRSTILRVLLLNMNTIWMALMFLIQSGASSDILDFLWPFKASYGILILVDILTTNVKLVERIEKNKSHGIGSNTHSHTKSPSTADDAMNVA